MTQTTKVRVVRCPKCHQLLAELAEVLLYRCGGCNTILQAKDQPVEANQNQLVSQDPLPAEEIGSLNNDKENERDEELERCSESSEYRSVSNELSFSFEAESDRSSISGSLVASETEGKSNRLSVSYENEDEMKTDQAYLDRDAVLENESSDNSLESSNRSHHSLSENSEKDDQKFDDLDEECMSMGVVKFSGELSNSSPNAEDDKNVLDRPGKVDQYGGDDGFLRESDQGNDTLELTPHVNECKKDGNYCLDKSESHGFLLETQGVCEEDDRRNKSLPIDAENGEGSNINRVHLETFDVLEAIEIQLTHDLNSLPKEEELLPVFVEDRGVNNSCNQVENIGVSEESAMPNQLIKGTYILDQESKRHDSDLDESERSIGDRSLSPENSSSIQIIYHENEELKANISECMEENVNVHMNECNKIDENEHEQCFEVFPEIDENGHEQCSKVFPEIDKLQCEARVFSEQGQKEVLQNEFVHQHTDEMSENHCADQNAITIARVDSLSSESICYQNKSNTEKKWSPNSDDAIVTSQIVLPGTDGLVNTISANENLQVRFCGRGHQDFGSASSLEFFGSSPISNAGPNLSTMSKDGYYYANNGGESSNDASDNQIHAHIPHPTRRKGKDLYGVPSSLFGLQGNQSRVRGGNSKSHSKEAATSRLPIFSKDFHADDFNGNHSRSRNSQPVSYTNSHSQELDKMDLLRTVCELKNQLNRIHLPDISREGRFHSEAMEDPYIDHLTSERDEYGDLNSPAYHLRYNQEKRSLYDGDSYYKRHNINCLCSHCRSRDRGHSTQSLPHSLYSNDRPLSRVGRNHVQIFNSSNPVDYTSDFSARGEESELNRQRHRDDEMKRKYLRERYHTSKKFLRPVAGGCPFVSCYHCSELLQIPTDFLIFKTGYHQLRCSACLKVLKFFLRDGMHLIPCLPTAPASNETEKIRNGTFAPMPQSIYHQPRDSLSCSNEYRPSFSRAIPPSGLNQKKSYSNGGGESSGTYFEANQDKKMKSIWKESTMNKSRNADINFPSIGTSSGLPQFINATSEIKELEPLTNFPLHQLMGYRTPSHVFKR